MREIKFRAWDSTQKRMIQTRQLLIPKGLNEGGRQEVSVSGLGYGTKPEYWLIAPILMQHTGLKDKNGKECYWDDWVTDGINPRFLVTPDHHLLARLSEIEFEIVGNKYEME